MGLREAFMIIGALISIIGLFSAIQYRTTKDGEDKRGEIYEHVSKVKEDMEIKHTSKGVCEERHKNIDEKLTQVLDILTKKLT